MLCLACLLSLPSALGAAPQLHVDFLCGGKAHQIAIPNEWLAGELGVRVTGNMADESHLYVCYSVASGNGKVSRTLVRLDQNHSATTRWMLETQCGQDTQYVSAWVVDMSSMDVVSDTLVFTARIAEESLLTPPHPIEDRTPRLYFCPRPDVVAEPARVFNVSEYQPTILVCNPCRSLISVIQFIQSSFVLRQLPLPPNRIFSLRE